MKSLSITGALDTRALVIATWSDGSATFVFAMIEGARESVDALRAQVAKTPEL